MTYIRGGGAPMDVDERSPFTPDANQTPFLFAAVAAEKSKSSAFPPSSTTKEIGNTENPFNFESMLSAFTKSSPKPQRRVIKPRRRTTSHNSKSFHDDSSASDVESDEDVPVKGNARKRKKKSESDASSGYAYPTGSSEGFSARALLLPYMISGYVQMFFSVFIIGIMLYIIVQFITTVRHDLEMKAEEYSMEIIQQVADCSKNYLENKCDPRTRVQFMQKACQEWEICMQRDPKEVGRLKVGAETLAEILNKLIEPLSYKTMAFGTVLLFGTLFLSSAAFGLVKGRAGDAMKAHMQTFGPGYGYHPYSPHTSPSAGASPWATPVHASFGTPSRPEQWQIMPSTPTPTKRITSSFVNRRENRMLDYMDED